MRVMKLGDQVYESAYFNSATRGEAEDMNIVCGLHIEDNIKVVPKSDNAEKGYWKWPDMP